MDASNPLDLQRVVAQLREENAELRKQIDEPGLKAFEQIRDLRSSNKKLTDEFKRVTSECVQLAFKNRQADTEHKKVLAELAKVQAELAALGGDLDRTRSLEAQLGQSVEELRSQLSQSKETVLSHEAELDRQREELLRRQEQMANLREELEQREHRISNLETLIQEFKEQYLSGEYPAAQEPSAPSAAVSPAHEVMMRHLEEWLGIAGTTIVEQVYELTGVAKDNSEPSAIEGVFEALQDTALVFVQGTEQQSQLESVLSRCWEELQGLRSGEEGYLGSAEEAPAAVEAPAEVIAEPIHAEMAAEVAPEAAPVEVEAPAEVIAEPIHAEMAAEAAPEAAPVEVEAPAEVIAEPIHAEVEAEAAPVEVEAPAEVIAEPIHAEVAEAAVEASPAEVPAELVFDEVEVEAEEVTAGDIQEFEIVLEADTVGEGSAEPTLEFETAPVAEASPVQAESDLQPTAEPLAFDDAQALFEIVMEEPSAEEPSAEEPSAEEPSVEEPSAEEPATQEEVASPLATVIEEVIEEEPALAPPPSVEPWAGKQNLIDRGLSLIASDPAQATEILEEALAVEAWTGTEAEAELGLAHLKRGQEDIAEHFIEALPALEIHDFYDFLPSLAEAEVQLGPLCEFLKLTADTPRTALIPLESKYGVAGRSATRDLIATIGNAEEERTVEILLDHIYAGCGIKLPLPSPGFTQRREESSPAAFVGTLRQALRLVDYTLFDFQQLDVVTYDGPEKFIVDGALEPNLTLMFHRDIEGMPAEELRFLAFRRLVQLRRRYTTLSHLAASFQDDSRLALVQSCLDVLEAEGIEHTDMLRAGLTAHTAAGADMESSLLSFLREIHGMTQMEIVMSLGDWLSQSRLVDRQLNLYADRFAARVCGLGHATYASLREELAAAPGAFAEFESKGLRGLFADSDPALKPARLRVQRVWTAAFHDRLGYE